MPLKLATTIRDFEESTYRRKITTRCTAAKTKHYNPSAHFDIVLRAVEPSRTLHSKINCTVSTWQTVRWQPLNVKQHPIESQSIQYLKASSRRVHRFLRSLGGMWCSMCTSQCPQKTLEAERHRQREGKKDQSNQNANKISNTLLSRLSIVLPITWPCLSGFLRPVRKVVCVCVFALSTIAKTKRRRSEKSNACLQVWTTWDGFKVKGEERWGRFCYWKVSLVERARSARRCAGLTEQLIGNKNK